MAFEEYLSSLKNKRGSMRGEESVGQPQRGRYLEKSSKTWPHMRPLNAMESG